jgi:hypothetical protein
MKLTVVLFLCALCAQGALADESVRGYTRQDGTYVEPHHRTAPNNTRDDNYSTRGNTNPYTGQAGTERVERASPPSYNYPAPSSGNSGNPYGNHNQAAPRRY